MFAFAGIFIVLASLCLGQTKADRSCTPDTVDFNTKLEKSTVVVYGKTMAKIMNEGSESIFSVSFQVDCILKGPATVRQINITNAGNSNQESFENIESLSFKVVHQIVNIVKNFQSVVVTRLLFLNQHHHFHLTIRTSFLLILLKSSMMERMLTNYWLAPVH